jgi:hypothetical protein
MARLAAAAVGAALAASITAAPAQTIVDGSGQSVPPDHLAILLSIARDNSPNMELAQVRVAHVLGGKPDIYCAMARWERTEGRWLPVHFTMFSTKMNMGCSY